MSSYRIGTRLDGAPLELPEDALLRHAVSLGASGSGKTVAMKAICEEAARHGIPVIAVDPQGDLASLGLFAPREAAIAKGCPAEVYDGYRERAEVVVWTPASTDGVPIAVNPLRARFDGADAETVTKALTGQAEAICGLLEISSKSAVAFLHTVLEYLYREKIELADFGDLARFLGKMPKRLQEEVQDLAKGGLVDDLERALKVAMVGARGLLFRLGAPIDVDLLLGRREGTPGKARVSVIYLNTLGSQEEKDFFVQMLVAALYQWMLRRPSEKLQALFYIDEVAPYLPPVRKPACKEALQILLKQSRKYGIGCLLASQNPGDIDYKALSQVSTWNLGRVLVKQDLKKVEKFFQALAPVSAPKVMKRLPGLAAGEFEMLAPDAFEDVAEWKVRWLASEHKTLEAGELGRVNASTELRARLGASEPAPAPAPAAGPAPGPGSGPGPKPAPSPAPAPRPEVETAVAAPRDEALDAVRAALEKEPRVLTRKELCDETRLSPARVDRALERLEGEGLLRRYESGRAHAFSWHEHKLRPDLGLTGAVERFKTQVFENRARELAEGTLETSFFVKQEEVVEARFFYFPLVKVHFKAVVESGWIFKDRREGTENIYLHPRTADIVHCEAGRVEFRPTSDAHPLELVDLDNKGVLEPGQPGDLDLREEDFAGALPLAEVRQRAARKFPIEILSATHAFLPCWAISIKRKEGAGRRTLYVDAVLGAEVRL
jgi:hypothetical protein